MKTLYDFGLEVSKIREATNSLEVKGEQNASLIVYIVQKCNDIIQAINEASKAAIEQESTAENQNGSEEGDSDGHQQN